MDAVNSLIPQGMPPGVPHLVVSRGQGQAPRVVRAMSTAEVDSALSARETVEAFTADRIIVPLRSASEETLKQFLTLTAATSPNLREIADDLTNLEAALRSWLSEFRAFVDHTSALVSTHFGKRFKGAFVESTHRAFDRNAAYLLACGLRNHTQHRGLIVNYQSTNTEALPDGSGPVFRPVLGIVPSELADASSGKTRAEMVRVTFPVRIDSLVAEVMNECERVMIEMFMAVRAPLSERVQIIEGLTAEADASEGGAFVLTLPDPPESIAGTLIGMYDCPAQARFDEIYRVVDDALPLLGEPDYTVTMAGLSVST